MKIKSEFIDQEVIPKLRWQQKSCGTGQAWITRVIRFHHKRHPRQMGSAQIAAFLTPLAVDGSVAASAAHHSGATRRSKMRSTSCPTATST